MKRRSGIAVLCMALIMMANSGFTQKFYTKTGRISFYSSAPLENIEAINKSSVVLLNSATGDLQFSVLMKGFEFRKALMQEHFNKDYVQSDKYPKSEFKGSISNNETINYTADASYPVKVSGSLTIHGVTKQIETSGTVLIKDGKPSLKSVFNVLLADYGISIPKLYRDNISKSIKITVDCALSALP
jgi:hypothetical protein